MIVFKLLVCAIGCIFAMVMFVSAAVLGYVQYEYRKSYLKWLELGLQTKCNKEQR